MGFRIATFALAAALLADNSTAFVPHSVRKAAAPTTARSFGVDPSAFQDLHQHIHHLPDAFGSMTLSDAMDAIAQPAADAVSAAGDALAGVDGEEVVKKAGWFGFLTVPIEGLLQAIHSGLSMAGMESNSWGVSIVALTVLIKVLTFPLTKTQLESTNKMQAMQPMVKEVQEKYQSNPEVMNQKISELYSENDVNPLAGCLPSLVQIPVFIGLYRAVLNLAQDNVLDEKFLFLPNLEGPTYGADPAHGTDWLLQWVDGAPALGWEDTIAFVALPVFLVISQVISMQLMQPKDPAAQQNNPVLKLLPLMIGWFALNVPAALTIYWVVNNLVTTATTLAIRNSMEMAPAVATSAVAEAPPIFAPPREKPAGFASSETVPVIDASGVKTLTNVVDVEIESDDGEEAAGAGMEGDAPSGGSKKKRGKKRKKRSKN
jgi:YidC/Oxa1 family membrane protein insertase